MVVANLSSGWFFTNWVDSMNFARHTHIRFGFQVVFFLDNYTRVSKAHQREFERIRELGGRYAVLDAPSVARTKERKRPMCRE